MSTPRKTSVAISIQGSPAVDITSDLISFEYEEAAAGVGECLTVELDDSSKRYRSIWFVPKGTQIQAKITCTDWSFSWRQFGTNHRDQLGRYFGIIRKARNFHN